MRLAIRDSVKNGVRALVGVSAVWWCVQMTLGKLCSLYMRLSWAREFSDSARSRAMLRQKYQAIFAQGVVLNGPFEGMLYPENEAVCSALYPKLLGSYESEIRDAVAYILEQDYSTIVDVGCAEGYYAVGFAMRCRGARVLAFDTCERARELCSRMALANGVDVSVGGFLSKQDLLELDLGERSLVVCDCEGYEADLIDREVALQLSNHDFLIETHDFIRIDITQEILDCLRETHRCDVFDSVDDILKAYRYEFKELVGLDLSERREVLAEGRPKAMRWVFARGAVSDGGAAMRSVETHDVIAGGS